MHTEDEVILYQKIETPLYSFCLEEFWEEDDAGYCVSDYILAKHTRLSVYDRSGRLVKCFPADGLEFDKEMSLEGDVLSLRWQPSFDRRRTLQLNVNTLEPLPYDLIAFDMDGTLLDSSKKIREDSLTAIAEAVSAGKTVALSTGRCLPELQQYLPVLKDVSYIIGTSGAFIWETAAGKNVFSRPFPRELLTVMLERAAEEDIMVHMLGDISVMQKNHVADCARYSMGPYQSLFSRTAVLTDDLREYYASHDFTVYKLNLYTRSTIQRESLKEIYADLPVALSYSESAAMEYNCAGVSKASGLVELCRVLDLPVSRTIAVGDADNDLAILRTAGYAIAMGNANEHAKNLADAIVANNDSGGCAEAIRDFLMNAPA